MRDKISKYRNYFLGIAIVLSSIAISIRSNDGKITLVLGDYPVLIFFMVVVSTFLVVIYVQANKRKIESLSNQIKDYSKNIHEDESLISNLTTRQREVYDLIISGKTNKEIMAVLFIEQSTLKTHINQIYRKLNIKSRLELKSSSKT